MKGRLHYIEDDLTEQWIAEAWARFFTVWLPIWTEREE